MIFTWKVPALADLVSYLDTSTIQLSDAEQKFADSDQPDAGNPVLRPLMTGRDIVDQLAEFGA